MAVAKQLVNKWLSEDHKGVRTLKRFTLEIEQTHENLDYLRTL